MSLDAVFLIGLFVVLAIGAAQQPGFALAFLFVWITADTFTIHTAATTITPEKAALVGALVGLPFSRPPWGVLARGVPRLVLLALTALLVATALSTLQAADKGAALRETLKALQALLTAAFAILAYARDPERRTLVVFAFIEGAVIGGTALLQEFGGAPSGLWLNGHVVPRIAGVLEGPNQLAGFLQLLLPLLVAYAIAERVWTIGLVAIALVAAAEILTLSRSGVITCAIAVALVFVLIRGPGVRKTVVALATGVVGGAGVAVAWSVAALARFASLGEVEHSGGVGTRSILWHAAIALWERHPVLGIGAGNFENEIPLVGPRGVRTHANSWYLQSLVEGGIPLLAATFAVVAAAIVPFVRLGRERLGRDPLVAGILCASIGIALHQIVDFLVFYPKVGMTWWLLLGVAAAAVEVGEREAV